MKETVDNVLTRSWHWSYSGIKATTQSKHVSLPKGKISLKQAQKLALKIVRLLTGTTRRRSLRRTVELYKRGPRWRRAPRTAPPNQSPPWIWSASSSRGGTTCPARVCAEWRTTRRLTADHCPPRPHCTGCSDWLQWLTAWWRSCTTQSSNLLLPRPLSRMVT